jgi:hypothetical protein
MRGSASPRRGSVKDDTEVSGEAVEPESAALNEAHERAKAEGWGTMTDEQAAEMGGLLSDPPSAHDCEVLAWCMEASWQRMRYHHQLATANADAERLRGMVAFLRKAGEMFLYAVEGEGILEVPSESTRQVFRWALTAEPESTNEA